VGKVRPDIIKRTCRELIHRFPEVFTTDFETNKKLLPKYTSILSKKVRNRIAGYIVSLLNLKNKEISISD